MFYMLRLYFFISLYSCNAIPESIHCVQVGISLLKKFFFFPNILEQMLIYNTGLIPSRFYEVLGDRDNVGFKSVALSATLIIIGTSVVSDVME